MGGVEHNPIGTLISYFKRIQGIKIGRYEASVKVREIEKLYKLDEINQLIPDILALCERRKAIVLIDELDQGWDGSEEARSFVAGLFHACLAINQRTPNLRVLVSLRKELYDNIPTLYQDSEKHTDIVEELVWDEKSLLDLISARIRYSVPGLADMTSAECWANVFEKEMENGDSFGYIIDRTLYRPREVIQFCSLALEISRREDVWPINIAVVKETEKRYSARRLRDIASEYRFQYPGLLNILDAFRGKRSVFLRDDLETLLLEISIGDFRVDSSAKWVEGQDPTYLIGVLWRIGFLKAEVGGDTKSPSRRRFVGHHQIHHLNLLNVKRFQIHPMFQPVLNSVG